MNRRALLGSDAESYILLHFDDPNWEVKNEGYGGTVGDDFSYYAVTSNLSKFGGYSVYINGDRCHYGADFYIRNLPIGDYTLEFWFYRERKAWSDTGWAATPIVYGSLCASNFNLLAVSDDANKLDYFYLGRSGYSGQYIDLLCYNYSYYDDYYNAYGYNNAADKWCHIAYTYSSSNNLCCIYVAGKKAATFYVNTSSDQIAPAFTFGNSSYGVYGYFDELRVTPRILYTGNTITVPSLAFES